MNTTLQDNNGNFNHTTTNGPNGKQKSKRRQGGRGRGRGRGGGRQAAESYSEYNSITFVERPSSGRPGSPHRFFASSFDVQIEQLQQREQQQTSSSTSVQNENGNRGNNNNTSTSEAIPPPSSEVSSAVINKGEQTSSQTIELKITKPNNKPTTTHVLNQIVHKHANGLCILTTGENTIQTLLSKLNRDVQSITNESNEQQEEQQIQMKCIEFHKGPSANSQSVGGKRKKAKMMKSRKGNNNGSKKGEDMVNPMDNIATVTLTNGDLILLRACVSGSIIEINDRLLVKLDGNGDGDDGTTNKNISLLITDPLLDGYVAVIMPNGKFPPPSTNSSTDLVK